MEPNNGQADPYAFITTNKGGLANVPKGLPKRAKLLVFGGGAILALILFYIIFNLFFKTPENSLILTTVGKQQGRILQAAELGVEKARGQEARNLAVTTQLSLIGDQKPLLSALRDQNIRLSIKDDEELEQTLITAEQANRFDQALTEYLETELTSYVKNLETAYDTSQSKSLREVLEAQHRNALFLAGESAEDQEQ